jgi:hypothetical protein
MNRRLTQRDGAAGNHPLHTGSRRSPRRFQRDGLRLDSLQADSQRPGQTLGQIGC